MSVDKTDTSGRTKAGSETSPKDETPRPEEIQREIESVVRQKFGDRVKLMGFAEYGSEIEMESDDGDTELEADFDNDAEESLDHLNFEKKPREVKEFLDRYVIRQDEAKKALAIAVCDHYNHVRQCQQGHLDMTEYAKQNILLIGPTGVGKTYLVKQIAKLIGVPFVKADATRFTEMGFVGSNVDDLIRDLVQQAGGNIELAQYGIIYLDEADKLATSSSHYGRDIGGRGVQTSLLKIMEETEVDLRASNDMASQIQSFMEFQRKGKLTKQLINTKHILFIVSGAFTGLAEIIQRRLGGKTIGISAPMIDSQQESRLNSQVATEDLVKFGFEPEFVGRLPVRVSCENLSVDDLTEILSSSEGSIVRQYQNAFAAYNIEIFFTDCGLRELARMAHRENTGARALMTVFERVLRGYKYELPSTRVSKLSVDAHLVKNPEKVLKSILASVD